MKNRVAISYFFIHGLLEFVCFGYLFTFFANKGLPWLIALSYDFIAFMPQGIIGDLHHRLRKLPLGSIGFVLLLSSLLTISLNRYLSLALIAIGNAFIHEDGAIATALTSKGKLFPGALFVAGGSFGLIIGQLLGTRGLPLFILIVAAIIMEILIIITSKSYDQEGDCPLFALTKENLNSSTVIIVALLVVIARSYIGYAIPIGWKKEVWQALLLFFIMGLGKAGGGYLSDRFGARKVGVLSTIICIPFLLFGKNIMIISIIGVFLFSLTMSITFGMCLSVISNNPGLAFGITTIGLFLGSLPVFIVYPTEQINVILIVSLSLFSALGLYLTLK